MSSINVPTWNSLPFVQLAVDAIRRLEAHAHEILIDVSNGSDGTLAGVREHGLKHPRSPANIGIDLSVNQVAALVTQPQLLHLNDDMAQLPGWDRRLLKAARRSAGQRFMLSSTMFEPGGANHLASQTAESGREVAGFRAAELIAARPSPRRAHWPGSTWSRTRCPAGCGRRSAATAPEPSPSIGSDNELSMKLWLPAAEPLSAWVAASSSISSSYSRRHLHAPASRQNSIPRWSSRPERMGEARSRGATV